MRPIRKRQQMSEKSKLWVPHFSRLFVQSHDILYRVSQDISYTPLVREAGEGERCLGRRWMCESSG